MFAVDKRTESSKRRCGEAGGEPRLCSALISVVKARYGRAETPALLHHAQCGCDGPFDGLRFDTPAVAAISATTTGPLVWIHGQRHGRISVSVQHAETLYPSSGELAVTPIGSSDTQKAISSKPHLRAILSTRLRSSPSYACTVSRLALVVVLV